MHFLPTGFDIQFKVNKQEINFKPSSTDQNAFHVLSWISVPKTTANFSLLRVDSESMSIDISYVDSLYIRIKRYVGLSFLFFIHSSYYEMLFLIQYQNCARFDKT